MSSDAVDETHENARQDVTRCARATRSGLHGRRPRRRRCSPPRVHRSVFDEDGQNPARPARPQQAPVGHLLGRHRRLPPRRGTDPRGSHPRAPRRGTRHLARPVLRPPRHGQVRVQALLRERRPRMGGLCRPEGHARRHLAGTDPEEVDGLCGSPTTTREHPEYYRHSGSAPGASRDAPGRRTVTPTPRRDGDTDARGVTSVRSAGMQ